MFDKGIMRKLIFFILEHSPEYFEQKNNYIYVKEEYSYENKLALTRLCSNVTNSEWLKMKEKEQEELFGEIRFKILFEVVIKHNKKIVKRNKLKRNK